MNLKSFYILCSATTVRRNQHLLINRAPALNPGPCLVLLDPAKKWLRYPNLKSKTSLLLQYSIRVSHKKSLTHPSCSSSLLIPSTLLYHCLPLLMNLCSSSAGHHCCKLSTDQNFFSWSNLSSSKLSTSTLLHHPLQSDTAATHQLLPIIGFPMSRPCSYHLTPSTCYHCHAKGIMIFVTAIQVITVYHHIIITV